jgi:hypothetical protein
MIGPEEAANLTDVPNIRQKGTRLGNWLTREQAKELLAVPDRSTLNKGKRDYVILALLVGCALRRNELAELDIAAMPCHHALDEFLAAYIAGAGLAGNPKGPLFRTLGRGTGQLTGTSVPQQNAHAMIRRRAAAAGIGTRIGNHSFRGHGDHGVSQKRRHAREGRRHGQPPLNAHHAALRPPAR